MPNYYDTLRIDRYATRREIEQAYLRILKRPTLEDEGRGGVSAHDEAWAILSDPALRKSYDDAMPRVSEHDKRALRADAPNQTLAKQPVGPAPVSATGGINTSDGKVTAHHEQTSDARWRALAREMGGKRIHYDDILSALVDAGAPLDFARRMAFEYWQTTTVFDRLKAWKLANPELAFFSVIGAIMVLGVFAVVVSSPGFQPSRPGTQSATADGEAATPQPLAPVIVAALPGYDPVTRIATLKLTARLPSHAAFKPYQAWVGAPLESRFVGWDWLAKDIKGYFFATAPSHYDCHACTPLVAVIVTALDGSERVVMGFTVLGPMGSFGTFSAKEGTLRFKKIAPDKNAILFDDIDVHQGVKTTVTHIVENVQFRYLGAIRTSVDSETTCQGSRGCLSYKTEMRFAPPVKNGYYTMETVTTGHR